MKKSLLTITLSLIVMVAFSQAKVAIGLKAGANFSNSDAGSLDTEGITSFHGGAFGLIKLANIGIQPEILFSKQGSELDNGTEVDLSYVNIPVMLKLYIPGGLNIQAGPQFGILTDAVDQNDNDLEATFKNSDLSAAVGAGWDAPFGLQITARYVFSLSDSGDAPNFDYKNKTFQLALGYSLFKIGR